MPDPSSLDVPRIARTAGLLPAQVSVVDEIASTSTALMEVPFGSTPVAARVLVARRQTAGRGRRGKAWIAPPGAALAMSVAVESVPGASWHGLPLSVGVRLAQALAPQAGARALRLKWPNDLLLPEGKLGGLLVEMRRAAGVERLVVGVGLNLLPRPELTAQAGQPVAALWVESSGDASVLAGQVAGAVLAAVEMHRQAGLAGCRDAWARHDALAGRRVRVLEPDGSAWEGEAAGIDDQGALRVRTSAGLRSVLAGEVSVRALAI